MRHTLLMFDVDLTLVDAAGAGQVAMLTAGQEVCGDGFTFDGVSFGGRLDPLIFADATADCDYDPAQHNERHAAFREAYIRDFKQLLDDGRRTIAPLPGVHDLIDTLRERATAQDDVMLGLLTGNYEPTATLKIEAAGIQRDWFTLGCFGDEAPSRPGLTELAMQRYTQHTGHPAKPDRVIIIGDTQHDVACAKAHGCTALAVATGRLSAEELKQAGADLVLNDLTDPTPLLDLINS